MMNEKIKFRIKEGYPPLSVIFKHKKYRLGKLNELPADVFKYAKKKGIYGIVEVKPKKEVKKVEAKNVKRERK